MCESVQGIFIILLFVTQVRSYVIWEAPGELHPVHGLYVRPSIDGTTGDLYVAATEDNGVKSQWLNDQPVNFLPTATKTKTVPAVTSTVTKTTSPKEETIATQKQAIITNPAVPFAYALPMAGVEEGIQPYPYAFPSSLLPEGPSFPPCSAEIPVHPYPLPYLYPYMMSAIASAMTGLKEGEVNGENSKFLPAVGAPTPYWPHTYAYPFQYLMVDPSAWAQSQTNGSPLAAPTSASEESS